MLPLRKQCRISQDFPRISQDNLEKNHRAILRYPDPEIGSNMGRYWNKDIPGISRDHPDHKFPSRKSCDNPVLRILRSWSQEIILMSGFTDLLALSWPWDNPGISCEYPENVLSSGPINVLH